MSSYLQSWACYTAPFPLPEPVHDFQSMTIEAVWALSSGKTSSSNHLPSTRHHTTLLYVTISSIPMYSFPPIIIFIFIANTNILLIFSILSTATMVFVTTSYCSLHFIYLKVFAYLSLSSSSSFHHHIGYGKVYHIISLISDVSSLDWLQCVLLWQKDGLDPTGHFLWLNRDPCSLLS